MRLDKYIANSTALSRKQVHRAVKSGEVCINGKAVSKFSLTVAEGDKVTLDGAEIKRPGPRYFMLHKPKGYVCANKDEEHGTVIDLIHEVNSDKLQIAGRLDIDTSGLVLITDDGQWNHRVTSPKKHCEKVYHVVCAEKIDPSCIEQFKQGVQLESESQLTLPASLSIEEPGTQASLCIVEGKYHQVKRMFAAVGNHVNELHRHSIGSITLDPTLAEGEYRPLNTAEINSIL